MSRTCWIDASVGIAGDMLLAALLDAGAREDAVRSGLGGLDIAGWSLAPTEVTRGAFRALYAGVTVDGEQPDPHAGPADGVPGGTSAGQGKTTGHVHTGHTHTHVHAGHTHSHTGHGASGGSDGVHRPYREVQRILKSGGLPERVYTRALAVYDRLARAEAHIHGMSVDDVVLHEVGAVDAIVDIVGCCLALEDLGIDTVIATPLPMGTGSVMSAHGVIPLPAPATLSICRGYPVVESRWPGEWVTPTGAALVCALARPGGMPAMVVDTTGYGAGRKDPSQVANVVRVVVGRAGNPLGDDVTEVACTVDDMLGEHIPGLIERLITAGALDAWVVPVLMKKGRPGHTVHALTQGDVDAVSDVMLRHSSTLGVRRTQHSRRILDRSWHTVETPYGIVRVKVGGRDGETWHASAEHDDVALRAESSGVSEREVYDAALHAWRTRTS